MSIFTFAVISKKIVKKKQNKENSSIFIYELHHLKINFDKTKYDNILQINFEMAVYVDMEAYQEKKITCKRKLTTTVMSEGFTNKIKFPVETLTIRKTGLGKESNNTLYIFLLENALVLFKSCCITNTIRFFL